MRKVLSLLLLITSFAHAQDELGVCKQAQKYATSCSVYPSPKSLLLVNLWDEREINYGDFSNFDRWFIRGVHESTSGLIDLIGGNASTAVNSPTYTTDKGYKSNGTNSYINDGISPTATTQYTQNSCSYFVYVQAASMQNKVEFGQISGNYRIFFQAWWTVLGSINTGQCDINGVAGGSGGINFSNASPSTGFFSVIRTTSLLWKVYIGSTVAQSNSSSSNATVNSPFSTCQGEGLYSTNTVAADGFGNGSINQGNLATTMKYISTIAGW